jgi:hyperosmotically inducible protein
MMNSNPTSRIVIGVGLLAVFGVGVSVFAMRAKQQSEVARNAPVPAAVAPAEQSATDAAVLAQSPPVQGQTDQAATSASVPPAAPSATAPAPVAQNTPAASDESRGTKSKSADRADRHVARTRNSADNSGTRVASAGSVTSTVEDRAPTASSSDNTSSAPTGAAADAPVRAQIATEAASGAGAGAGATTNDAVASDSQITNDVKSEIATAAPSSNVDVTTTNGVVALAGSAPSQDAVDQARQAAQRVAGVKHVDASAMTVSNQ